MPPTLVIIHIFISQKALDLHLPSIEEATKVILRYLPIECDELGLYFVTKRKIGALHRQFFDDPAPTDCITFPIDSSYLGDIFICPAVARDYAKKHKLDPFEETLLYLVHGILHLAGFDDLDPVSRKVMRKMEKKCMRHLKLKGINLDPNSH